MENKNVKIEAASEYGANGVAEKSVTENTPFNVMADGVPANQEPTPVNGFDGEGDQFTGMTREELLAALNKTGVATETITGTVVEDAITGETLPGNTQELIDINSLQDLQPENIKRHLAGIIKQTLTTLIPEDLTEEDADAIIASLEEKIANLDKKDIKAMDAMQIKNLYGTDVFNQIKRFNPTNYNQMAKKLLVDFKDGIVEYQGVVDSMEEINRHMKFFQDIDVDQAQADIKKQIDEDTVTYPTEFHKYKKYLQLYLEYLASKPDYENNPFMEKEKEVTNEKIAAISEAIEFTQIFAKCEHGKQKLLKDFRDTQVLNRTIFDFVGKLNNDTTMNISFPMPKNFSVKSNVSEVLTSVWVSFLEMAIIRGQFQNVKSLTSSEYVEMTQILRGEIKEQAKKVDEVVEIEKIDLKAFIAENNIEVGHIVEARKAAIAISYIIARTFKPTVINNSQYMKYVLSYTMNILTQSMYNDGCNQLLLNLVEGIKARLV